VVVNLNDSSLNETHCEIGMLFLCAHVTQQGENVRFCEDISTDCRVYLSKLCSIRSFFDMPTLCAITPQVIKKKVTSSGDSRTAKSRNDC